MHIRQLTPRRRTRMTIRPLLVARQIRPSRPKLVIYIAREIPIQISLVPTDTRRPGLGDQAKAVLVDVLEQKTRVRPSEIPSTLNERISLSVECGACVRVLEVAEIVIVPMDDHRAVLDVPCVVPIRRVSAHGFRESESKETDTSHECQDDTDQPHFLTPGPLLFGRGDT